MNNTNNHIIDKFGRIHDYLRISLTERCNLRCFYCMPEDGVPLRDKEEFMTSEELISIAKIFVQLGVKKIRLTGGEPLVKKNFGQIISELSKLPIELAITSNGILIDKYLDELIAAGIRNINISLDSLKEERFNEISRRNYYQRIRNNIDLLLKNNFNVKINVVIMKGVNDDEIIDFIEWSRNESIQIRFIEFMPFNGNNWNSNKKVSLMDILNRVNSHYEKQMIEKIEDTKHDTSKNYRIKGARGSFGIISSVTSPFCSTCNRIRLTADGKIKNCLFSQSETDLLKAYRDGKNINQLIIDTISNKKKERGGLADFSNETIKNLKNRTMVSIGG